MRPKLSIIIPVYNVEKYLRKCVDSLLAQDLPVEDYEIILVDDGSTDGSAAICDEYVAKFPISNFQSPIIRVIHQANAGVGAARNAGLKVAKGEYVCFVDSDDYWEPNVLATLMGQVEREKLDVLRFDYRNVRLVRDEGISGLVDERYEVFEPNKYPHRVDMHTDIVSGEEYLEERMGYACYPVMFVIRRDLIISIQKSEVGDQPNIKHQTSNITHSTLHPTHSTLHTNNILFTEGIHFEDTEWLPRMMLRAKRVNSTSQMVYNYLLHQGSITQVQGESEKIRQNIENTMFVIEQYAKYQTQYPQCRWLRKMRSIITLGVLTSIAREFYKERKEYIARLMSMNVFPLTIADQGKTYIRRAKLVNLFGPRLYCSLMHAIHTFLF